MTENYLEFEKSISEIDKNIARLHEIQEKKGKNLFKKIRRLKQKRVKKLEKIYSNLSGWETIQVSRHKDRPLFQDYLEHIITDFSELHGDRCYGDDKTIITGLGKIGREKVMIIGQEKGRGIEEKVRYNFGSPNPEGYRKANHKMRFAEKYGLPVVTFIDTPGACPGIGAEERGQAQSIAENLKLMSQLKTPIVSVVIGEGGSGGALGIGVGDRLAMLEHAYYSVVSPEGCAAILWKNKDYKEKAANALKLRSKDLYELGLIDEIISEPVGGAHRNPNKTFANVNSYLFKTLRELKAIPIDQLVNQRYEKLRNL